MILGLVLALGSALGGNVGFLLKQRGAVLARPIRLRHPARSAVDLFRSRWFLVGWIVSLVAWVLHVAALSLAALSSVQAVFVGRARLPGGVGRAIFRVSPRTTPMGRRDDHRRGIGGHRSDGHARGAATLLAGGALKYLTHAHGPLLGLLSPWTLTALISFVVSF